jgi:hypothetical protein
MKLLFTGHISAWLLLTLLVLASGFTILVYRRHRIRPPWSWFLPLLRIAALALITLALMQPVLGKVTTHTTRGRIPVVIDTTASMGIRDRLSPGQAIATADSLGLLPPALRSRTFAILTPEVAESAKTLTGLVRAADQLASSAGNDMARLRRDSRRLRAKLRSFVSDSTEFLARAHSAREQLNDIAAPSQQGVRYQRFDGLSGNSLGALPDEPDHEEIRAEFAAARNQGDQFADRLFGWISPPMDGAYHLLLSCDDQGALLASPNANSAHTIRVAEVPDWVEFGRMDKYPAQRSIPLTWRAGQPIYVEAQRKEGEINDHLIVGWERPDGLVQSPIPGAFLSPQPPMDDFSRRFSQFVHIASQALAAVATAGQDDAEFANPRAWHASLSQALEAWRVASSRLADLQGAADSALAGSDTPTIREALRQVGEMRRIDVARRLLDAPKSGLLHGLRLLGEPDLFDFGEPPQGLLDLSELPQPTLPSTRLASVVQDVLSRYGDEPVAALVLVTDGNSNAGKPLADVRTILEERKVPLLALGVGSPEPPPDIAISRVLAPRTAFSGDIVDLNVTLHRHGYEDQPISLSVRQRGRVLSEVTVPPGDESILNIDLTFAESASGFRHYRVAAELKPGEIVPENNRRGVSINVLTDPIKVLLVDEFPRWESRYLADMLERDKRVGVEIVFGDMLGEGTLSSGGVYPDDVAGLFRYDLIVLGDIDPKRLTLPQVSELHSFVVHRGGTLVLMAGPDHMPVDWELTPLGAIMPVSTADTDAKLGFDRRGIAQATPALQEAFAGDELLQIGRNSAASALLWGALTGLDWVRAGVTPAANAETLARTTRGDPLLLYANAGLGKVLYLGSDSFWRWRYRARATFHRRLWSQILLWSVRGRTAGANPFVKIITDRAEYSPDEPITVKARVFDRDQRPLEGGTVSAEIFDADGGLVRNLRFVPLESSGGEYRARVAGLPRGEFRIVPRVLELADIQLDVDYRFRVSDLPTNELVDLAQNETALRRFGDAYATVTDASSLLKAIPNVAVTEEYREDFELWDTIYFLLLIVVLLGAEWQLRKVVSLV